MKLLLLIGLTAFSLSLQDAKPAPPEPPKKTDDVDTQMMRTTFRIWGPSQADPTKAWTGTAFLMAKPLPTPAEPERAAYVCITAGHVLQGIAGDLALGGIRVRDDRDQETRINQNIRIRDNGKPLWVEVNDVAALYCPMPDKLSIIKIPMSFLATDKTFDDFNLHPGDEVRALGYPFGYEVVPPLGYSVLHSGRLASFPLTPMATVKTFIVDFPAFGGNSGGPVYFLAETRVGKSGLQFGSFFSVLGVVTRNITSPDGRENVSLTVVVHANSIREAIDKLPPLPESIKSAFP